MIASNFLAYLITVWGFLFQTSLPSPGPGMPPYAAGSPTKAFVNACSNGLAASAASLACSASINLTSGNLLVVNCGAGPGTTITVTDTAGNTFTGLTADARFDNAVVQKFFYAKNTTANASDIPQCNFSPNVAFTYIFAAQYSGASTTAPLDANPAGVASNANISTFTSPVFTTTVANEAIIVVGPYQGSASPYTAGAGCTIRATDAVTAEGILEDCIVTSIQTSATRTFTGTASADTVVSLVSFK